MKKEELIEIMPIEYHRKVPKHRHPRLQIYWDYSFSPNLTKAIVEGVVRKLKNKERISIQSNSDRYILWRYGTNKPQICLDNLNGKVCVSTGTLKRYSLKSCQHQASLVLRILKGTKKHPIGLANFRRISATFDPYRIGRTAKEREITFQAAHDLFNDRFKGKEE
jgi:hypothetical protein